MCTKVTSAVESVNPHLTKFRDNGWRWDKYENTVFSRRIFPRLFFCFTRAKEWKTWEVNSSLDFFFGKLGPRLGERGGGEAREVGTGMGGRRTESEKIIETCECVKKNLLT